MSKIKIDKVVSVLPDPLEANTIYAVRVGTGFDLYISDSTGSTAHGLNLGIDASQVAAIAGGLDGALNAGLLAAQGRATRATHVLQAADNTPAYVACIKPGLLFRNGSYVKAMAKQEVFSYTASQGDQLQCIGGSIFPVYRRDNNTPFEANNPSQAGKIFFWNRFRGASSLEFITALLPVDTSVKIWGPNPSFSGGIVQGTPQHDVTCPASSTIALTTNGSGEYYMETDFDVLLSTTNVNGGQDPRTVPPPTKKLFGITRSGGGNNCSSLQDGTVFLKTRLGTDNSFSVGPGSPARIDVGWPSGYNDTDLNKNAFTVADGDTQKNIYAGADSAGVNAIQWLSADFGANVFVLPTDVKVKGSENGRCVIGGQYECEVYVFAPNGSYITKIDIRRNNGNNTASPATTKEHQEYPAAENFEANLGLFAGLGDIERGTMFIANMPVFFFANLGQTADSMADDDETPVFGDMDETYLCRTRRNPLNDLLERERLNDAGTAYEWVPA